MPSSTASSKEQVIEEALRLIEEKAVYPVEKEKLVEGALRGMADMIGDPYSTYFSKEEAIAHKEALASSRVGIGAEVTRSNGKFIIVAPIKGSPAEQAGLQPYDEIIQINGERLESMTLQEVVNRIRGKKGTVVTLMVYRPEKNEHFELKIMRASIPVQTVQSELVTDENLHIGYVTISTFGEETAQEWHKAASQLLTQGSQAFIIDVRGNPGGYLQSVHQILSTVLPENTVYAYMKNRKGELEPLVSEQLKDSESLQPLKSIPIILLQNKGSASASEMLTGAVSDLKRGNIIGTDSFGKGTVQETMNLSNGGEVKISTYQWLTPKETWIHGVGVKTQLEVKQHELFTEHIRFVSEVYREGDYHDDIAYGNRVLQALGYAVDRQDGYFDESTATAVKAFHVDKGLQASEWMDQTFFEQLRKEIEEYRSQRQYDNQLQMALDYAKHLLSEQ